MAGRWGAHPFGVGSIALGIGALLAWTACTEGGAPEPEPLIHHFQVDDSEPPADLRGLRAVVVPQSEVALRWELADDVTALRLLADDEEVASWIQSAPPPAFRVPCSVQPCTTSRSGDLTYTLEATGTDGKTERRSLQVRVSSKALQIHSFRALPGQAQVGAPISLSWQTSGALSISLWATPLGGGPSTRLLVTGLPDAHQGSFDTVLQEATHYRLVAVAPDGSEAEAESTVTERGAALFTSLRASPQAVHAGTETTLSWSAVGLERLAILPDDGGDAVLDVGEDELDEGSRSFVIHQPTSFLLVGTSTEGEVVQEWCDDRGCREARVDVALRPRPLLHRLEADPPEIDTGETSTLRFAAEHAEALVLTWQEGESTKELHLDALAEQQEVAPTRNTTYTLHVMSNGGIGVSGRVEVRVRPVIAELSIEPANGGQTYYVGEPIRVAWKTLGAQHVQLDIDGVPVDIEGLDLEGDEVDVVLPDRADGSRIAVTLSAFRDQMLAVRTTELTVHRRGASAP